VATVEAQLRALEDAKVAEAEKHAQEMRTMEDNLNAAHAGKQVSTQQHIAHWMLREAQSGPHLWYEQRQHNVLACFDWNRCWLLRSGSVCSSLQHSSSMFKLTHSVSKECVVSRCWRFSMRR